MKRRFQTGKKTYREKIDSNPDGKKKNEWMLRARNKERLFDQTESTAGMCRRLQALCLHTPGWVEVGRKGGCRRRDVGWDLGC